MRHVGRQDGVALVLVLLALLLLTALGVMLALATSLEATIAVNFRETQEAFYAAEAGIERAMDEVSTVTDWNGLVDGSLQSSFVDGAPAGLRLLSGGSTIDLAQVVNQANCRKVTACSPSEMNLATAERPWGANNPRWQLYAYGSLRDLLPSGASDSPYYIVVMVADDASERDNDPLRDGAPGSPGAGAVMLRAEAFGPRGARKRVEATVARGQVAEPGRVGVRVLSWYHVRD